ncbi:unnamed protein product [Dicrocoelium dendriticum]|nr:unnamed protein product [Dicrocoelium dendriticum]
MPATTCERSQVAKLLRFKKLLVSSFRLFRISLAESIGVGIISFMIILSEPNVNIPTHAAIIGAAFAVAVWITGPISGGHVNPIVSLAFVITRRISVLAFVAYVCAQVIGAIVGSIIAWALMVKHTSNLGVTRRIPGLSQSKCIGLEILGSFVLVMSVLSTADEFRTVPRTQGHVTTFPIVFGITMALLISVLAPYTGAGMNPAVTIGTSVISRQFNEIWIYIVGPFVGSVLAALIYEVLLTNAASIARLKAWCTERNFDRSRDYCVVNLDDG